MANIFQSSENSEPVARVALMNLRLIARLDIKGPNLIKGIHLEGLRVIGDPQAHALKYYEEGADELIYMDIVASLYNRNNLREIVARTAKDVFIPMTVGGGIRTPDDVKDLLRVGADKIALNTAVTQRPELIREIARRFGSQCVVLSIEAKRISPGRWEAYTHNGRERTGKDVVAWAKQGAELGAGEILITSIDQEGTRKGFDLPLVKAVTEAVSIPVIVSGGMGSLDHLSQLVKDSSPDAVAFADCLHYNRLGMRPIREHLIQEGKVVRRL
jgi:cyclase